MSAPDDDHVCQEVAGARVHASPDLTPEARGAIAQLVEAAQARYARENAPVRHSLASVVAGGPLYPPVEVRLVRAQPYLGDRRVAVTLAHDGRRVEWTPTADLLDDPYRLSDALEAMLRRLCPPPAPRRLP